MTWASGTHQESESLSILLADEVHGVPLDVEGGGVEQGNRLHPFGDVPSDVTLLIKSHLNTSKIMYKV